MLSTKSKVLLANGKYKNVSTLSVGDSVVNHRGDVINILSISDCKEKVTASKVTSKRWYTNTFLPIPETKILSTEYPKHIKFVKDTNKDLMDTIDLGAFLGLFLTKGVIDENNNSPCIIFDKAEDFDNGLKLFNTLFPKLLTCYEYNKMYIDPYLTPFLLNLKPNIHKYIVANKTNNLFLAGLEMGIKMNTDISNVSPEILEAMYLIYLQQGTMDDNSIKSLEESQTDVRCVEFDASLYDTTLFLDNILIRCN